MTHVGERMKLLNCVSQDMEALANILASAPRAVSKYRANVPDHLSGHCKMAAGSGLGTRLISTRPLFEPGFYSGPASIKIFFLILGLVSNIKSVVYSMAPRIGRMTASQDSHATSSVMKESVVRGHHVYKAAADSLVVFSAHSTAFNLKETS